MQSVDQCPLCGNHKSSLFDSRLFRDQKVINRICTNCGLVFQSPHMDDAELQEFYNHEYRLVYQGQEGPTPKEISTQRGRAKSLVSFMHSKTGKITRHLDIGCSLGFLLQEVKSKYDTHPVGVEPGAAYREYAQQQALKVYASLEELKEAGENNFDLISMAHVLEHLPDPVSTLKDLRENLLSPEGWLLIEVPNLYAHDSFEIAHLVSFSPHTLTQVVQKAGYKVLSLQSHGRPRSRVIPLYLTLLAQPVSRFTSEFHVRPEKGVSVKRRLGMLHRRILTRLLPRQAWLPIERIKEV